MDTIELDVLIIDDDNEHVQTFRSKARKIKIKLHHFRNFEDGIEELDNNFNDYHGIILDARCFWNSEDEEDELLSDDGIDAIAHKVRELTESKGYIPYCINTGYSAKFKNRLKKQGFEVYSKPMENDDVLKYIREQNKIENKYYFENKGVMDLFRQKILNPKYLFRLSKCFDRLKSTDPDEIRSTATTVREVMEDFYKRLEHLGIIPTEFVYNNLRPTDCSKYLVGKLEDQNGGRIAEKYKADSYIGWLLTSIHSSSSKYSHNNMSTESQYIQKTMLFSLLEVLDWFNKKIVKHVF